MGVEHRGKAREFGRGHGCAADGVVRSVVQLQRLDAEGNNACPQIGTTPIGHQLKTHGARDAVARGKIKGKRHDRPSMSAAALQLNTTRKKRIASAASIVEVEGITQLHGDPRKKIQGYRAEARDAESLVDPVVGVNALIARRKISGITQRVKGASEGCKVAEGPSPSRGRPVKDTAGIETIVGRRLRAGPCAQDICSRRTDIDAGRSPVREARERVVLVERGNAHQVRVREIAGISGTDVIVSGLVAGRTYHDNVVGLRVGDGVAEYLVEDCEA